MDPTLFQGAIDIVEYFDNTHPCPSFKGAYESWSEEIFTANEIEVAQEEQETLEAYTDLVGNILNLFIQSSLPVSNKKSALERKTHIQTLIDRPNVPQRTQAWYEQSRNVLTASEFSIILGTPRAVATLALQKTMPPRDPSQSSSSACSTYAMGPMDWGVRFEPVVKQILTTMWKANILDIGRLIHPTIERLAASPDGLVLDAADEDRIGRLVEIKCPIRRVINDTVPFEYWCQMQIQMEVAGIDECEYVEVKLDSITSKKLDLSGAVPDGHIWLFQDTATCKMMYAYTEEEKGAYELQGMDMIETIPWKVNRLFTKTVARDRAWFQGTAPMRQKFWEIVEKLRTGEIILLEPKQKQKQKVTVEKDGCLITNDP